MSSMFVITLGDVIGLSLLAMLLLVGAVVAGYLAIRRWLCAHQWRFVDAAYGAKYWECKRCGKKHQGLERPIP